MKNTEFPKVLGTDGVQKMSKSLNNHIELAATPEETQKRVMTMVTDPQRARRTDPGRPEVCNVFTLHQTFSPGEVPMIDQRVPRGRHRLRGLQEAAGQKPEHLPGALPAAAGRAGAQPG